MSASGSRPDYVEEFERKLAAAHPCEPHDWRTPSRKAATVSGLDGGAPIAVGAATAPLAGGSGAVGASQPVGGLSDRTPFELALKLSSMEMPAREPVAPPLDPGEASSADQASQPSSRTAELIGVPAEIIETATPEESQAIADTFSQGGGNGPEKEIAAADPVGREAARAIEAADCQAHETDATQATKRGSQGWKFKALVFAVSAAMIGAVFMRVGGMLAPLSEPSTAATGPNQRENMISEQGAAGQAQSDKALAPSASSAGSDLLKDRPEVYSAAVGATATAPQGAETAAVDASQPAVGPSSGTSPASIASTPAAPTPPTPPPAQSSDLKPVPTVSRQPAPIASPISPAAIPTDSSSEGQAPQPNTKPTGNGHELGTTNPSAPGRDVPTKVVGKPSTREVGTKNDATRPRVAVRTPAKHHNSAEPKAAQSDLKSSAATPAATNQLNGIY